MKFANIQEDTPSYHRRYDFFIAKFSAMCHSNHSKPDVRERQEDLNLKYIKFKSVIVVHGYVKVYHKERIVVILMVRHVFPHML